MSGSLKQIKNRLRSIENTSKITHAMEMVSVSKLKSTESLLRKNREYFRLSSEAVLSVVNRNAPLRHPYFSLPVEAAGKVLILVTSDTGLCSTYNQEIIRAGEDFARKSPAGKLGIIAVGKKGFDHFQKRGYPVTAGFLGLQARYKAGVFEEIFRAAEGSFLREKREVYVAYTAFRSALNYKPQVEKLLPLARVKEPAVNYLFEPSGEEVLEKVLPELIRSKLRLCLLESFSSEHSSRAIAMKSATDNARDLRKYLVLTRNKMRQAAITKEIIEVISSAEALKG